MCAPAPSSGSKLLTKSHKQSRTDAEIQSEQSGADSDADSQRSLAQLDKWLKQHINDGGRAIMAVVPVTLVNYITAIAGIQQCTRASKLLGL
jgi:hypothetical protein